VSASSSVLLTTLALFLAMLVCLECGYRIGHQAGRRHPEFHEGLGAIEAAIFALLGLLLGFAFAGALSRLDARRQLIVREANVIGTAYLRVDLLPSADQPAVRQLFRDYLEMRLRTFDGSANDTTDRLIREGALLQQRLWARIVDAAKTDPTQNVARIVVPAMNEMIDVTTARTVALRTRLPTLIFGLLVAVAVLSAFVAGYAMAQRPRRSLLHMLLYAATVSVTVYTLLDLDNPRVGLIRLDATDRILRELHDSIR